LGTLFIESLPDSSESQPSRCTKDQPALQFTFQLLHVTADCIRRHAKAPCRLGEASGPNHLDEKVYFVQVEHAFLTIVDGIPPS